MEEAGHRSTDTPVERLSGCHVSFSTGNDAKEVVQDRFIRRVGRGGFRRSAIGAHGEDALPAVCPTDYRDPTGVAGQW